MLDGEHLHLALMMQKDGLIPKLIKFMNIDPTSIIVDLEEEMENAFRQRTDLARRKGEEASSRLLLPLFGMLSVVMAMTVAPAFLMV